MRGLSEFVVEVCVCYDCCGTWTPTGVIPILCRLIFPRPGAGAWLTAVPASRESHISSEVFHVGLLRMPVWDSDTSWVPCGEVLDRWGDHAL